ncbi:MAG TPA: DUF4446 family protein [Candidatus Vogelbacteria bacterium]|nr:DUF4446 family protein [Candidatus Vogelbacteria bacterium]
MDLETIITISNAIIVLIALLAILWLICLEVRWRKLFNDQKNPNLDSLLDDLKKGKINLEEKVRNIENRTQNLENKSLNFISKTSLIRFNPFRGEGGNQSFVACFLNNKNNGLIISSIHSREKINVYAKPIKNKTSPYEMSVEEKEALDQAC